MNTRMKLWFDYRKEIESNINLQKAVKNSNETLNILYNRLLKVFPEYKNKYHVKKINVNANTEKIDAPPRYSNQETVNIINSLSDEAVEINFDKIDNLDFSSHDLDDVAEEIKNHRSHRISVTIDSDTGDMVINSTKILTLKKDSSSKGAPKMKNKNQLKIAIDGPSGSGKSTVAKLLAKKYNLNYINTGLVYRAIALNANNQGINLFNKKDVIKSLENLNIELLKNEEVLLNGVMVTKKLRADEISQDSSKISIIPEIRKRAVEIQQKYGSKPGSIMDGRDTTFVVMPNADIKIYLDTNAEIRAKRRVSQNQKLGYNTDLNEILKEIIERDERDMNREVAPLHVTKDAIYLDASEMTTENVVNEISKLIDSHNGGS